MLVLPLHGVPASQVRRLAAGEQRAARAVARGAIVRPPADEVSARGAAEAQGGQAAGGDGALPRHAGGLQLRLRRHAAVRPLRLREGAAAGGRTHA